MSQKHFKLLTVAIGKEGETGSYHNDIISAVGWFAGPVGQMPQVGAVHNFSQATHGRGTLETGALGASLKVPFITTQPVAQAVLPGQTASFSLVCSDTTGLLYQWQVSANGGASWGNLAGTALYSGTNADTLAGTYAGTLTNTAGEIVTSGAFPVTIGELAPPIIITHPSSQTLQQGATATSTVAATGENLSYQWQKNSANIPGATSATHTKTNAQPTDAAAYRILVSNAAGSATSNPAMLTVSTTNGGTGSGGGAPSLLLLATATALLVLRQAARKKTRDAQEN